ncbi:MAG: glycoside hydrolase family 76 protein [Capsulimonadales bacterium]|nr:glycoside hydrolase family 76 protein [Capsulimonadales bacterium]
MTRRSFLSSIPGMPRAPLFRSDRSPLPSYRERAESVTEYLLKAFWVPAVGRFRPAVPPDPKALPYDFMWANGIAFSAFVGGLRYDPPRFRPLLDAFFMGLEAYFDRNAPAPAYDAYFASPNGDDKYYDDNAWMVLTFSEAFERTGDRKFLDRAAVLQRYVYTGWDEKLGGGIYWRQDHKSKNTCSNGPTATAAVALARHTAATHHLNQAKRIVAWTNRTLQAPDGTFWDNLRIEDGKIEKTKWTYNTALMLRANLGIYRCTREAAFLAEARRLAQASVREFVHPETGAFRDEANFSHLLVEAFLDLYTETREPYLLEHARRNADFAYLHVRDPQDGGYFTRWRPSSRPEERKTLMANASVARLFWLMAPFDPHPQKS